MKNFIIATSESKTDNDYTIDTYFYVTAEPNDDNLIYFDQSEEKQIDRIQLIEKLKTEKFYTASKSEDGYKVFLTAEVYSTSNGWIKTKMNEAGGNIKGDNIGELEKR